MNQFRKIAFLLLLFAVPLLITGFLHFFGSNRYQLPMLDLAAERQKLQVYNPQSVNCPVNENDTLHRISAFSLVNQSNNVFTEKDLAGKIYVAEFFFTRCPDICLTMTSELLRVQEKFKKRDDFFIVSHSVDPENDSTAVLQRYAESYRIDTQHWALLTGDKQAIYNLAACSYFIAAKPAEPSTINFVHSDKVVLVDKERRIRGYYSGTDREDVDRLITEIQILLKEYEQ